MIYKGLYTAMILGCSMFLSTTSHANLQSKFLFLGQKTCQNSLGSMRIVEPDDLSNWTMLGLSAPTRMLRVFVDKSKCFTVVDRGVGFSAAQLERELAGSGHLKSGQNIGAGQMRVADYILVPDIVGQNLNAGGSSYGIKAKGERSFLGSVMNTATLGIAGRLYGSSHKKTAEVVLTLIDVRTSEQVASVNAEAKVSDRALEAAIQANQGKDSAQAHYSSWSNTEIGKVIQEAYSEAFDELMIEIDKKGLLGRQHLAPVAVNSYDAGLNTLSEPTPSTPQAIQQVAAVPAQLTQSVVTTTQTVGTTNIKDLATKSSLGLKRIARLLAEATAKADVLTELKPGMLVYPTGEVEGNMIKVEDEMGHIGWVSGGALSATE